MDLWRRVENVGHADRGVQGLAALPSRRAQLAFAGHNIVVDRLGVDPERARQVVDRLADKPGQIGGAGDPFAIVAESVDEVDDVEDEVRGCLADKEASWFSSVRPA